MLSSVSPFHSSISTGTSLQLSRCSSGTRDRGNIRPIWISPVLGSQSCYLNLIGQRNSSRPRNNTLFRLFFTCFGSPMNSRRRLSSFAFSMASPLASDGPNRENELPVGKNDEGETDFNWINSIAQVLHQSANSFTIALQHNVLARDGPQLAKAWVGVDVHAWHKHITYQAAVYALLWTAMEPTLLPHSECDTHLEPVQKILYPKITLLRECLESQLSTRNTKLVEWFKVEQLPALVDYFTPLIQSFSTEYSTSGVAVVVLAISCCIAVGKLGTGRVSCPSFTLSLPDVTAELLNLLHSLVSIDKLHTLASETGFEHEFLAQFGPKALRRNTSQEIIFWIALVQKKLMVALQREGVVESLQRLHRTKIVESDLATLGLFTFLGRQTRLFLSCRGIKDLDEPVKNFLGYLECGSLFIYPELSSVSVYQLFTEVVAEEIGWIDFYPAFSRISCKERRRSKQHAVHAKKEIILSTVYTVCSDLFKRFGHFSKSTKYRLDRNIIVFLLRSQNLLSICIEDYLAAYDMSHELQNMSELSLLEPPGAYRNQEKMMVHHKSANSIITEITDGIPKRIFQMIKSTSSDRIDTVILEEKFPSNMEITPLPQSFFRRFTNKLMSTSSDIWMGTRLLFMDILVALGLLHKQICRHTLTKRQTKKLRRTIADVVCVIPVAILMLLPVSAVGHAAILAAIKKYIPCLIPSPYSSERLDVVKQLNRTKKMEDHTWSNLDITSSFF